MKNNFLHCKIKPEKLKSILAVALKESAIVLLSLFVGFSLWLVMSI